MFERFNDGARHIVILAQEYARTLGHTDVTPEHLLLALLHNLDGEPVNLLRDADVQVDALREQVKSQLGTSPLTPVGHIPFTSAARDVLYRADAEAEAAGAAWLGEAQILGALTLAADGPLRQLLTEQGVPELNVSGAEAPAPASGWVLSA